MLLIVLSLPVGAAESTAVPSIGPTPTPTPAGSLAVPGVSPAPTPTPSTGRTWWVDTAGSDRASGTRRRPLRTLARALVGAAPGDTIQLGRGRHAGADIRAAGRRGLPITIAGMGTAETIVDGTLDGRRDTLRIRRRAGWLVIRDLTVTGSSGSRSAGVLVEGRPTGPLVLERLRLTGNDGYGALLQDTRDVTLRDSELDGNRTGVEVNGDGANVVISGSRIHDNDRLIRSTPRQEASDDDYGASGVSLAKTTGPVLVTQNLVWGNRAPSPDYGWDGSAFEIFAASGVTISDNIAWDNENVLETGTIDRARCRDNVFVRNIAWGGATAGRARGVILRCGTRMLIANVTLADLDEYAILIGSDESRFAGSIRGARITNSLLVQANEGAPLIVHRGRGAGVTLDHVLLWNDIGPLGYMSGHGATDDLGRLARWLGAPDGLEGAMAVAPRFVDRRARDLRLAPDSPAIDAGTVVPGVTDEAQGIAPDLGALEHSPDVPGTDASPLPDGSPVADGSPTPSGSPSPAGSSSGQGPAANGVPAP
ncbi:MAG: right-handed parallel beta-helix repeat-containing protein [Chloroflexi bacterium]|nr:right-handed parallel beta-helix repeat-containing protein [Chloroflexota bacterium]